MERLISFCGLFVMIGLAWLLSSHKRTLNMRVIVSGLLLQFGLALFILRTGLGQWIFSSVGLFFENLLGSVKAGSGFLFGAPPHVVRVWGTAHDRLLLVAHGRAS